MVSFFAKMVFIALFCGMATLVDAHCGKKFIGDFEKFVNEFVETAQKAMAGDPVATAHAVELSAEFAQWKQRAKVEASHLPHEQLERVMELGERAVSGLGLNGN
jgi:hypothetical protein